MGAGVDHQRLDLHDGVAAAIASFASMLLAVVLAVDLDADDGASVWSDPDGLLTVLVIYAGAVWLAGFVLIGLPAAVWIERRTRMDASWGRRLVPYSVAGLVAGGLLFLVHPIFLPATFASALGGKAGVELRRRCKARHMAVAQ
ncbi:hypothetical protein [Jiangella rhizosphaerae]|uniref:Uncharacterized protein n=1 Tax=Jiangella rhizosphaerae TaxID=2293569 RepID=A0A418KS22_9ACTN|nr:hypothetical protein [Jiangella rhizosphaerae]RIQ25060.1 hypothetical protein DY240_11675 [Jiangella rhizosphaerae]